MFRTLIIFLMHSKRLLSECIVVSVCLVPMYEQNAFSLCKQRNVEHSKDAENSAEPYQETIPAYVALKLIIFDQRPSFTSLRLCLIILAFGASRKFAGRRRLFTVSFTQNSTSLLSLPISLFAPEMQGSPSC